MKKIISTAKIIYLLFLIVILGVSIYYKNTVITVGSILLLLYSLYIFIRWKRMKIRNNFKIRTHILTDVFLFCFVLLFFRMIQIQLIKSDEYKEALARQINMKKEFRGERGEILDRNGKKLAYNTLVYEFIVNPERFIQYEDSEKILKELQDKKYININFNNELKKIKELGKINKKYRKLEDKLEETEKKEIESILKKYGLERKGIFTFISKEERKYYKKDLYFYLVGNVGFRQGSEKEGIFGLELFYEKYLKRDKRMTEINGIRSLGLSLPMADFQSEINIDGRDVYLTIDDNLQYILNDEVEKQYIKTDSEEAYGLIMDPNTGKILATAYFKKDKNKALNPIFQYRVEPGSIFKPLIIAAGLEEKKIRRDTKFDIGDGTIKKYNHTIKESTRSTKGILTVDDILRKSSNVGMVMIGDRFTNEEFNEYLKEFGFYEKTGVDYPYEKTSSEVPPKRWHGLKKSTMSFGQGIAVTPIQMLTSFSALINGGKLYRPYLVEKITDDEGIVIKRNLPYVKREVISQETSDMMRDMLRGAVEDGTVKRAYVEGYEIGGKTGTAQISEGRGYAKGQYISSVIGFFPVEKPKYAILVMLYKPSGKREFDRYGGATAAPILGSVVKRVIKSENLYFKNLETITYTKDAEMVKTTEIVDTFQSMPNLKGMTAREVINTFGGLGKEVEIVGSGVVESQYPKENTPWEKVDKIKVILK